MPPGLRLSGGSLLGANAGLRTGDWETGSGRRRSRRERAKESWLTWEVSGAGSDEKDDVGLQTLPQAQRCGQ